MRTLSFNPYNVYVVDNLANEELKGKIEEIEFSKAFIITDENVLKLYKEDITQLFPSAEVLAIKPGEENKNLDIYKDLVEELLSKNIVKDDLLISFGGGVVCDITGFIAASIKRGVRHINIATTIVGQIDASIGGKVAVDVSVYKNQVGTFYDPIMVVAPVDYLKTLPEKEVQNGFGELFKMALIGSKDLYKKLQEDDFIISKDIIEEAILIKRDIVAKDYFDCGERHILNFGHTFGHAIEAFEHFKISHGIAVLNGIKIALVLGEKINLTPSSLKDEILSIIQKKNIKLNTYELKELKKYLLQDKKCSADYLRIVIIEDISSPSIIEIDWNELDVLLS